MEIGAKNTQNTGALWCELQICRWRESHGETRITCQTGRGYFVHRTNSFPEWRENPIYRKSRNE